MDIYSFDTLDSTNTQARRMLAEGTRPDFAVRADIQTAGRGRFNRPWQTPRGNLALTIVTRVEKRAAERGALALLAGLAIHDAVAPLVQSVGVRIKWPNDVLIDGGKLSGTLIEGEGDVVFVGIGINVAAAPEGLPYPAARLGDHCAVTAGELGERLAAAWERRRAVWDAHGFAGLLDDYTARLHRMDQPIRIALDRDRQDWVDGTCRGVNGSGHLLIEAADGTVRAYVAGDVGMPGGPVEARP